MALTAAELDAKYPEGFPLDYVQPGRWFCTDCDAERKCVNIAAGAGMNICRTCHGGKIRSLHYPFPPTHQPK